MLIPSRMLRRSIILAVGVALAGCTAARHSPTTSTAQAPTQSGKGGYKVGNPYQIDGTWYYPAEDFDYDETGIASWYGEAFHGKYTANGEVFDLNAVTAAHRTLPMPTILEVTNLENGRRIQVRVNDRGPYARGRIIDLSRRSAQLLGFEGQGTAKVRVRILVAESIQAASLAGRNGTDQVQVAAADMPKAAPRTSVATEALTPLPGTRNAPPPPTASLPRPAPAAAVQVASVAPVQTDAVSIVPVKPTQIYIQVGAFTKPDNAWRLKSRLDPLGAVKVTGVRAQGVDLYRVRLGPVANVDEADKLLARVVDSGVAEARIVVD
jgi:rare lipoprotein A